MRAVEKRIPLAVAGVVILAVVAGLLASLPLPPGAGAVPAVERKMYWTDAGTDKIQRADLSGSNVEELVTALGGPVGIALDTVGGKMYWTEEVGKIQRADMADGGNVEELVTGLMDPKGIALDVVGGKMYWTDPWAQNIQRANLDGSNVEELVSGLGFPARIALDVAGGKMYWTYLGGKIQRADMADGGNVQDVVTGLDMPWGIALDVAGGKMYWTDIGTDKIQRADLSGSNVEDLVTSGPTVHNGGIALDAPSGKMYWTDAGTDKIQRADMADGGHLQELLTGLMDPEGIALDAGGVVPGCEPGIDTDDDGFDNDVECYLGTDPLDDCPDSSDAWPPDMNMDGMVNIMDLTPYILYMGFLVSDPGWNSAVQRLDLSKDGAISGVADLWHYVASVFNETCPGAPHPPVLTEDDPVIMGIDPDIAGNSATNLGNLESCVRVDVQPPGLFGDGAADHTIDVYVTGDTDEPAGYDAWVVYDPDQVNPVDWNDLIKLPGAGSFTRKMTSRLNAAAVYTSPGGSGTPGDGTIVRIELDAISSGPACFAFGFARAYSSPGRMHPTSPWAAMVAINEACPSADFDGDGIYDVCDNCLYKNNPDQMERDGDGLGDACDNCPLDYNPGQENMDGDPFGDICDNCLMTPTPWFVPVADDDCDGFSTAKEDFVGTHSLDPCAETPDPKDEADDRWPTDFNDDQTTNIVDIGEFRPVFNSPDPNPNYDPRYDITADGKINIVDVGEFRDFFNKSCE